MSIVTSHLEIAVIWGKPLVDHLIDYDALPVEPAGGVCSPREPA
jgi:hypothetical protein